MEVTKEQLTSGLKNTPTTFEEFRRSLKTYSQVQFESWITRDQWNTRDPCLRHIYVFKKLLRKVKITRFQQVSDSWKEAAKSRGEQESRAVEELRQILMPEMINLVQRQRLGFIVEGTRFVYKFNQFCWLTVSELSWWNNLVLSRNSST